MTARNSGPPEKVKTRGRERRKDDEMRKTAGEKKRGWQTDNRRDELSCLREMCEPSESEVKDYYAKKELEF